MDDQTTAPLGLDLLKLALLLGGNRIKKRIFVSTGSLDDKARVLPAIQRLVPFNIEIFATEGTSAFLHEHGITNIRVFKIAEKQVPNAQSLLIDDSFDLVINILTGEQNYDEQSDARTIRKYAEAKHVPLITTAEEAISTISLLLEHLIQRRPFTQSRQSMEDYFRSLVLQRGGYSNCHAHPDKAYLVTPAALRLGQINMQEKWRLYDQLKGEYTHESVAERIAHFLECQAGYGVRRLRMQVDADARVKMLCFEAADEVRRQFEQERGMQIQIGTQPLQGVLDPEARRWFEAVCERADVVGGLPSKDRKFQVPHYDSEGPQAHIDMILEIGKRLGKPVEAHVDQENNPLEDETEMLARAVMKHGMEGRVVAIHAIFSKKSAKKQREIIKMLADAGITVCVNPSAALSMRPLSTRRRAPIYNSVAPVPLLVDGKVPVVLGTDNVEDFFMPFTSGDLWTEVRMLMEACRWYDAPAIADIACSKALFGEQQLLAAA